MNATHALALIINGTITSIETELRHSAMEDTMNIPTATMIQTSANRTVWLIKFPSTTSKVGKAYHATTYPKSDLIFIETADTRRVIASGTAPHLKKAIREAIDAASKQTVSLQQHHA